MDRAAAQERFRVKKGKEKKNLSNRPKLIGAAVAKKVTPMIESAEYFAAGHNTAAVIALHQWPQPCAEGHVHIDAMTSRMMKALSTGRMDVVRAVTMLRSVWMRPKMRMMRKARMRRSMLMGMSIGPSAMRDMKTTKKSNMLLFGWAGMVSGTGIAGKREAQTRKSRMLEIPAVGHEGGQPVGIHIDCELAGKNGCEEEIHSLQDHAR
jgi:hypothetical protein